MTPFIRTLKRLFEESKVTELKLEDLKNQNKISQTEFDFIKEIQIITE